MTTRSNELVSVENGGGDGGGDGDDDGRTMEMMGEWDQDAKRDFELRNSATNYRPRVCFRHNFLN